MWQVAERHSERHSPFSFIRYRARKHTLLSTRRRTRNLVKHICIYIYSTHMYIYTLYTMVMPLKHAESRAIQPLFH